MPPLLVLLAPHWSLAGLHYPPADIGVASRVGSGVVRKPVATVVLVRAVAASRLDAALLFTEPAVGAELIRWLFTPVPTEVPCRP